jgi:hypothetical protein
MCIYIYTYIYVRARTLNLVERYIWRSVLFDSEKEQSNPKQVNVLVLVVAPGGRGRVFRDTYTAK